MEIKGKVVEVSDVMQVTDTFKKRELIVEYIENNPSYPEYLKFEALQDKCSILDAVKPGDEVEVAFNLRGRPWTGRDGKKQYFNSLVVWKLNMAGVGTPGAGVDSIPDFATRAHPGHDDRSEESSVE